MNITGYPYFNTMPSSPEGKQSFTASRQNKMSDSFELQNNVNFTGKKPTVRYKTIEEIYTSIDGLHDPYSEVIMISKKGFKLFKEKAKRSYNSDSMLKLLNNYQQHLFEPEKQMLEIFTQKTREAKMADPKEAKHLNFQMILQEMLPQAKKQLKPEQRQVLEDMKKVSMEMSENSRKVLEPLFKKTSEQIENDTFRIQPTIKEFESLRKQIPENKLFNNLIETSAHFPSSATSATAFIVKHANESHEEIAIAMIKPSLISIEHIQPKSKRGASSAENYIAASTRMNNLRKSLSLPKLIRRYPKIPEYTQMYFDGLINKVNRGGVRKIGVTLPDVKETLFEESKHFIDVNIDALSPQIVKQNNSIKSKLDELLDFFSYK